MKYPEVRSWLASTGDRYNVPFEMDARKECPTLSYCARHSCM